MTAEQKELLNYYLDKGYNSDHSYHATIHVDLYDSSKMNDASFLLHRDKWANDSIAQLEKMVEALKIYRLSIAERYNELVTAPTKPIIALKRERSYSSKKVYYYLMEQKKYIDTGDIVTLSTKKYSGTERKQAIEDFNKYVKDHPGIEAIKDIEKGRWEK